MKLPVPNVIPNLRAAVEAMAELDGLVFACVLTFFLDSFFGLMQAVVVEVNFQDLVPFDVMLVHALPKVDMMLHVGLAALFLPILPVSMQESTHFPVALVAHGLLGGPR
jgi:hypothetical protein